MRRLAPVWVVKTAAGVAVLGGVALAVTLPADTSSGAAAVLALPSANASVVAGRSVDGVSRSTARSSAALEATAVSAPAPLAPAGPEFGVTGAKAVAAPTVAAVDGGTVSVPGTVRQGACPGLGLTATAANVCGAVRGTFGISNIGGYRAGAWGDHGTGNAVDVMITSQAQGDAVAAFVQANAARFNIKYVIWRQRIWYPGSAWKGMEDRGSITQNHYDHVHISVN